MVSVLASSAMIVSSNQRLYLIFVASPLSTQHLRRKCKDSLGDSVQQDQPDAMHELYNSNCI